MTSAAPIFLIGYRGTGKSTVGQLVAERLGIEAIDADVEIERRAGRPIAAIFAEEGEAAFRDFEAAVVAELATRRGVVVALGGGAVLREATRDTVRAAGPVVWLTASVDTIASRIVADTTTLSRRPDLTAAGGRAEIEALLSERTPIYAACATFVVDTERKSPAEVADEIVLGLGSHTTA